MDVMLEALAPAQIERGMQRLLADLDYLDIALGLPAPTRDVEVPPLVRAA